MSLTKLALKGPYAKRMGKPQQHTVHFEPGVNLLIGPNGSGKSTIIECMMQEVLVKEKRGEFNEKLKDQTRYGKAQIEGPPLKVFAFDFEKQNARTKQVLGIYSMEDIQATFRRSRYLKGSHGEFVRVVLDELSDKIKKEHAFVLLDEPEQALDLDALNKLHEILASIEHPSQAIVATHHPFLIADTRFHAIEIGSVGYRAKVIESVVRAARKLT